MAYLVCHVTVTEVLSFALGLAFAQNLKGAAHSVCAVGITDEPVASPARPTNVYGRQNYLRDLAWRTVIPGAGVLMESSRLFSWAFER